MGFRRGSASHSIKAVHSFRNEPDKTHRTCVKCGCRQIITYSNAIGKQIFTYFDRYGNKLDSIPSECKGLYDLLKEE